MDIKFSSVILAGGESKRLGRYKPTVKLLDKPLLLYVIDALLPISREVIIVLKNSMQRVFLADFIEKLNSPKIRFTYDVSGINGILAGVKAGLQASKESAVFLTGCDLPLMNSKVVELIMSNLIKLNVNAVVPMWNNGFIEPLYAGYMVSPTLRAVDEAINFGEKSFRDLLKRLNVNYLSAEQLVDVAGCQTFLNINSQEDLHLAERLLLTSSSMSCDDTDYISIS